MPVWETPARFLESAIDSIRRQTFDSFELVLADDGSRSAEVLEILERATRSDSRITVVRNPFNTGIVSASNLALREARGEYIALMDHDDFLLPTALERTISVLESNPDCDLLYTDEAWIDESGTVVGPFFKPDWSPERLRSQMYVNHLSVYRRSAVVELGGFRQGFDGSQDYDLALRVSERSRQLIHLPEILYHWRIREGQVSGTNNPAVYAAARTAIQEHCGRIGIDGKVEQTDPLGIYRVHRRVIGDPLVSIVVPTRGASGTVWGRDRTFVVAAIESVVSRSTYPFLEYVVVFDQATPPKVLQELREICGDRLRLVSYDAPFNYARKMNLGAIAASGDYLLMLNDDVEVISDDWIETLVGLAQEPSVGMVGCALYFEDGTLQHGGHLYVDGSAGHIGYGAPEEYPGPVSALQMERECSGVTAACALLRRSDYLDLGGLSRQFPVNFNDVDFSLKVRLSGRRIVWTPHAKLYHFESKTRDGSVGPSEVGHIRRRWGHVLDGEDPYWRYPDRSWVIADASMDVLEDDWARHFVT